ncbi:hypothetical protein Goklo_014912 [Gossypium klotzschianum]|uniref:Uncharacterized protein n=1 Tax=Gossypium klotzschianum TaxID=34286 RepID=A0A7J8U933_9ROSI|nr:hypothetical protein [Gossypium klotzschianum]
MERKMENLSLKENEDVELIVEPKYRNNVDIGYKLRLVGKRDFGSNFGEDFSAKTQQPDGSGSKSRIDNRCVNYPRQLAVTLQKENNVGSSRSLASAPVVGAGVRPEESGSQASNNSIMEIEEQKKKAQRGE